MQRNANMLKNLKKVHFADLLVSLQKCSPQSVPPPSNELLPFNKTL